MNDGKLKVVVKRTEKEMNQALIRYQMRYEVEHLNSGINRGSQGSYTLYWAWLKFTLKAGMKEEEIKEVEEEDVFKYKNCDKCGKEILTSYTPDTCTQCRGSE